MLKRIPDEFIRTLIARANIIDIISNHVKLKKKGGNHFGCCPFHNEKTPSFSVNEKKQFFYCFGCGASGSVVDFLQQLMHLSFPETIEELAAIYNMDIPYATTQEGQNNTASRNLRAALYQLMERTAQFYQQHLTTTQGQSAVDYLDNRGVNAQIRKKFGLGFAPDSWTGTLSNVAKSPQAIEHYDKAGLLVTSESGKRYDRFRHRIMFPIRDRQGHVVAFGGRVIDQGEPKYLNSPETAIFHKGSLLYGLYELLEANNAPEKLLVVEGYMDVVSLAQFDINYAVASLGTATTLDQIRLLFRHSETVICCYDGDNAGRRAAWRTLTTTLPLLSDGEQLNFLFLPEGEDPDSLIRKEGKAKFEARLATAQSLPSYLLASLSQQVDLSTQQGRAKLITLAAPLINQVQAKNLYIYLKEQLNYKLTINDTAAFNAFFSDEKFTDKQPHQPLKFTLTTMRILIGLLVQYPKLAHLVNDPQELAQSTMAGVPLFIELLTTCTTNTNLNTAQLMEIYRDSNHKKQLEILATWNHMYGSDEIESIFLNTLRELYDSMLIQRLDLLLAKGKQSYLTDEEKHEIRAINLALSKTKKNRQ